MHCLLTTRLFYVSYYFIFFTHRSFHSFLFFFFNDTATTEIYTLSLHDALPISVCAATPDNVMMSDSKRLYVGRRISTDATDARSEEHTSELQSRLHLVCRLLLEKKKKKKKKYIEMTKNRTKR